MVSTRRPPDAPAVQREPSLGELEALLALFLAAPETEADALLAALITEGVEPVVSEIVRHRMRQRGAEAEDVRSEILLLLVRHFRRLRRSGDPVAIHNVRGYVAVAAYHACAHHRRRSRSAPAASRGDRDGGQEELSQLPDPHPSAVVELGRRGYLRAVWEEIRQLPRYQAFALLLHLQDERGRSAIALLPLTGTATMREIAQALGLSAEALAELWSNLPLDDRSIAQLLEVTRQQVINLRKSARERLIRRMKRRGFQPATDGLSLDRRADGTVPPPRADGDGAAGGRRSPRRV